MNKNEIEMTSGSLVKNIFLFSLPLVFSNALQIFFNLADVAIAGKFAGSIALGSVGSTTVLISLTTGIAMGFGAGVNAITARYVGAENKEKIEKCVHTSLILCLFVGIVLLLGGLFLSGPVLKLLGTKEELFEGAKLYMTVYLLGSPALALYNYGNAILNSAGETRKPLIYLTVAGVINVILNLFFVICFKMSVLGVALASIISQYISAALIVFYLLRCHKNYGINLKKISFDTDIASRIIRIGAPTAIQYSLFAISNLYIQSAVNSFSHTVVEGNAAAQNADGIVYGVMEAFYTACTSFIAQNYGAQKKDRIKKTYYITTAYSAAIALLLGGLLIIFKEQFLSMFTNDPDVIFYGRYRLLIMSCSYFISAFMDNAAAAARGLGKSRTPTIIVILGSVVFRVIWVCTIFAHFHTLPSLYYVYASAWIFTAVMANIYLYKVYSNLYF